MNSRHAPWLFAMGVPSFGNLRIEAYLQLPAAYRSWSRPSSAPDAKAFTPCSWSLELLQVGSRLNCCGSRQSFVCKIVFYPTLERPDLVPSSDGRSRISFPFAYISLFVYLLLASCSVFNDRASPVLTGLPSYATPSCPSEIRQAPTLENGLKWSRTTDLALIRRAL